MVIQASSTQIMDLVLFSPKVEILRLYSEIQVMHLHAFMNQNSEEVSWQFTKLQQFTKVEERMEA